MARSFTTLLAAGAAAAALASAQAGAADKVRFINSTKVVFEMEHAYSAKENGVFDRMGLDVSIIHGSGGAATLQTIITGSQDMAFGVGVLSVIAAYAKGAPVRILGSTKRGTGELYWYVKPESPLKSFQDLKGGKDLVYSRPGSTTHLTVLYLKDALKLDAKLVSVGGPSGSRTQLMSGQVATGWSVFPLNGGLLRENKIRIIGTGKEAAGLNGVTLRVVAANSDWLEKNRAVAQRMMAGLVEGKYISYSSEKQQRAYAKRWKIDYQDVTRSAEFVPPIEATFLPIGKLDQLNEMAVKFKRIDTPLTQAQFHELVHPMGNEPG